MKARVIKSTRNHYIVRTDSGEELTAVMRGKVVMNLPDDVSVKVGDFVDISFEEGVAEATIEKIHPRTSMLLRGKRYKNHIIATNIDQLLILMSVKNPSFKQGLLDRYTIIAEKNNLPAIIVINKTDLGNPERFHSLSEYYHTIGYPVYFTSVKKRTGIDVIQQLLLGKTTALIGQSGVGKSSLIRCIQPDLNIRVGDINKKTSKGKHTTTFVQLFSLAGGGYVIDTPGIKELGVGDILKKDLKHYFVEFDQYQQQCQFMDCNHISEPNCAVRKAVEDNRIFEPRYRSYVNIYNDLPAYDYEWEQGKVKPT
ncbi:MAG: ribosome small subunit-dependent GTPase A [Calditrichia bacterium]